MMPNEDDGMDDSLYSDESSSDSKSDAESSVDEEAAENPTALLPVSSLGGAKVGDTVTVKIVKLHGDEAEVKISSSDNESESESEPGEKDDEYNEMEI